MNIITVRTALEVAFHEAVVRRAYKDSVGMWTWSVGLTGATGHNVERYIGKPQTLEHCLAVFVWALNNYSDDVRSKFKGVTLTEEQFAAAVSFHWNTGAIRKASWVNSFLDGNVAKARIEIMNWSTPPEIIERRERERDLFFDGEWANNGKIVEWTTVRANGSIDWTKHKTHNVTELLTKLLSPAVDAPIVVAPEIPVPPVVEEGEMITPDWTAAEHIANIRASTNALATLLLDS